MFDINDKCCLPGYDTTTGILNYDYSAIYPGNTDQKKKKDICPLLFRRFSINHLCPGYIARLIYF